MTLSKLQNDFFISVFKTGDTSDTLKNALKQYPEKELQARLAIYKNNTFQSLISTLAETFPNTEKTVGKDFFSLLGKEFIQSFPPKQPSLIYFGKELPLFIHKHKITEELPYLADLAELEFQRHSAYYAKDEPTLTLNDYTEVKPDDLASKKVMPQASAALLQSKYAVYDIWNLNQNPENTKEINFKTTQFTLTVRVETNIYSYSLEEPTWLFLNYLYEQDSIGVSIEKVTDTFPQFNATEAIQVLIQSGFGSQLT